MPTKFKVLEGPKDVAPPTAEAGSGAFPASGSAEFKRGYSAGYAAGTRRVKRLEAEISGLRARRLPQHDVSQVGSGYVCAICGIQRPTDWFVYEVEVDGEWKRPCCAICSRKHNARGPFKQNTELSNRGSENE